MARIKDEDEERERLTDEEKEETRKATHRSKNVKVAGSADVDTWVSFIREFEKDFEVINRKTKEHSKKTIQVYYEQLKHMVDKMHNDENRFNTMVSANIKKNAEDIGTPLFIIDFADLQVWAEKNMDYQDESHNFGRLIEVLSEDPDQTLHYLKVAVFDLLSNINPVFAQRVENNLYCTVRNFAQLKEMPELNSEMIDRMCRIEGLILSYDESPRPKILQSNWTCGEEGCGAMNNSTGPVKPLMCYACGGKKKFTEQKQLRKKTDYIHMRIQERPDRTLGTRTAVDKQVKLEGTELVKYFYNNIPGSAFVSVTSIIRMGGRGHLSDTMIESKWIDVIPEQELIEEDDLIDELVAQEIPEEQMDEHYDKICRSICHTIYGHQPVKEGIAWLLAGSEPITRSDYSRIRGTFSILIIGDPSEGKSDFIRYVERVSPRGVLAQGEDASAVGLTAGINVDQDGIKRVTLGVCGLADNGIALIDELEKRDKKEFRRLELCMDDNQQMIVRKAGIHRPIWARCGHLHVGNAVGSGKWDPTKTIEEQTEFAQWMLRRYDLIFVVYDRRDEKHNEAVINYIGKTLAESSYEEITSRPTPADSSSRLENEISGQFFSPAYLRHEFKYVKKINPLLDTSDTSKPYNMIKTFWKKMKIKKIYNPNIDPEDKVTKKNSNVPQNLTAMDVRGIYSLIRASRAVARLYRSPIVEPKHVERVTKLFEYCITQLQPLETRDGSGTQDEDDGNGHGLRVTTIQNDVSKLALRQTTQDERRYQAKLYKLVGIMAKSIVRVAFSTCGNKECRGGQVVVITDPIAHRKHVEQCGDCEGQGGEYEKFTYLDVERDLVERKLMPEEQCRMIWKVVKNSGMVAPHGHGTKDYSVVTDPRSPDFVDTITSLITKVQPEDTSQPTFNRYMIVEDEQEPEPTPVHEPEIKEYPKMVQKPIPIGQSDKDADAYVTRELENLESAESVENQKDDKALDGIDLGDASK